MFQDIELGKECQAAFLSHLNKIQTSPTPVTFPGMDSELSQCV